MAALWTIAEQQTIRPISDNNEDLFDQLSIEVQLVELSDLLGGEFYNDLINNPSTYDDLLNGTTYECDGVTYTVNGLKHVLAYFFYSRYIYDSKDFDTFSGFVNKNFDDSARLSSGALKNKSATNRQIAETYWGECKGLIENDPTSYPYYNCGKKKFKNWVL